MPNRDTLNQWANTLIQGVAAMVTNGYFLSLLLAGWVLGGFFWYFWFKHQITNAKSSAALEKTAAGAWQAKFQLMEQQHAALKESIGKEKPADFRAGEIARGAVEVRDVVAELASGGHIVVDVDPLKDPRDWRASLSLADFRRIAALAYTSSNGISQSMTLSTGQVVITGTAVTASVAENVARITADLTSRPLKGDREE